MAAIFVCIREKKKNKKWRKNFELNSYGVKSFLCRNILILIRLKRILEKFCGNNLMEI